MATIKKSATAAAPKKGLPAGPAKKGGSTTAGKKVGVTTLDQPQKTRLWLMYPPKLITTPVIWEVGQKFNVVTNVRQASVTDEIGIVCLELDGKRGDVKAAIKWLEDIGVSVEPIEINVIES